MAQTENEKELILGNKQLISLFFLVVAMCGAFFAFGYMIGRNSGKPAAAATADSTSPPAATDVPGVPKDTPAAADAAPPSDAPGPVSETQPAQDAPAAQQAAAAAPPPPASASVAAPPPGEAPEAGKIYLQVTALRKSDADNLVRTLREQNLPALTAESSKADLFRVMVGPYRSMNQVADAKAKLKGLGFANAFVQK
jgi:cell division septation protein DedD